MNVRPLALFGMSLVVACGAMRAGPDPGPVDPERGALLYRHHCAACHGLDGQADGAAAPYLRPPARAFARDGFHLVSTYSGVPTNADVERSIRNGLPGSAMPGWSHLADEDIANLARHVFELTVEGRVEELLSDAEGENLDLSAAQALEQARLELEPGPRVGAGPPPEFDDALLDRGHALYLERCATCHDRQDTEQGRLFWNEDGTPTRPRDLMTGLLRGGMAVESILDRVLAGMPGTPMAATQFDDPTDAWAVAAYVGDLIRPSDWAWARQVQRPLTIQSAASVPVTLEDARWSLERATWVPFMPLWWAEDNVQGVFVRGMHDGERLALSLSWSDRTRDDNPLHSIAPDAFALMMSDEQDPPVLAMGDSARPARILQWKSWWEPEALGLLEVIDPRALPHAGELFGNPRSRPDVPLYRVGGNVHEGEGLRELSSTGPGELSRLVGDPSTTITARRSSRGWELLLITPLKRGTRFFAFAAWNGSAEERAARKSISIWHPLVLEGMTEH